MVDEFDEEVFNKEFVRCVFKLMFIKKVESVGDKVIGFICFFICYVNEKD